MADQLTTEQLRDRIAEAIRQAPTGRFNVTTITDAVLAVVQPELDRLRAELAAARPTPLVVRWNRTVTHPDPDYPDDPTVVCCLTDDAHPVALLLDNEYREALGLQLVDPDPEN